MRYFMIVFTVFSMAFFGCGDDKSASDDGSSSGGSSTGGTGAGTATSSGGSSAGTATGGTNTPNNEPTGTLSSNPKDCKAISYSGNSINAKKELSLGNKFWCGAIKNRFQVVKKGNDWIYDAMLKGFWSKSSSGSLNWEGAKSYCSKLANGYQLPLTSELISLMISKKGEHNYMNLSTGAYFRHSYYWSGASRTQSPDQAYAVFFNGGYVGGEKKTMDYIGAVCFRKGSL